jgi:MFS family permease
VASPARRWRDIDGFQREVSGLGPCQRFFASPLCAAQFVLQLDFSVVNVALPTIRRDLFVSPAELQRMVTGHATTICSLLLLGGRAADFLGRRRPWALGLVVSGIASTR